MDNTSTTPAGGSQITCIVAGYLRTCGISQTLLAEKLGIDPSRLSRMLSSRSPMTVDFYCQLCNALNVPPERFLKLYAFEPDTD